MLMAVLGGHNEDTATRLDKGPFKFDDNFTK